MIHSLSFGKAYPGMKNPLDKTIRNVQSGLGIFSFFFFLSFLSVEKIHIGICCTSPCSRLVTICHIMFDLCG